MRERETPWEMIGMGSHGIWFFSRDDLLGDKNNAVATTS
jgi:hypothetical protein